MKTLKEMTQEERREFLPEAEFRFWDQIVAIRESQGKKRVQLARELGMEKITLYRKEVIFNRSTLWDAIKIADALNCDIKIVPREGMVYNKEKKRTEW